MDTISFKRHRFPPEIIRRAVWLYARFTLSYRDVEDLLAERGLDISYESVRRWFLKLGAPIARNLRHTRPIPNGYWHLDERVIVIRGQRYWLWRGVDNEGEVLDFLVQSVLVQTGRGIGDNGIWRIAKLNGILYLLDVGSKTTSFSSAFAGIFASN